jgi:hypothetical protein
VKVRSASFPSNLCTIVHRIVAVMAHGAVFSGWSDAFLSLSRCSRLFSFSPFCFFFFFPSSSLELIHQVLKDNKVKKFLMSPLYNEKFKMISTSLDSCILDLHTGLDADTSTNIFSLSPVCSRVSSLRY